MPIYEYECAGCEKRLEMIRPLANRDALPACPICGGPMPRAITAHGGFVFAERKESNVSRAIRNVKARGL